MSKTSRKYRVRWRYKAKLELPRSSVVTAIDKTAAIARIISDHIDLDSKIRDRIEIIEVEPL